MQKWGENMGGSSGEGNCELINWIYVHSRRTIEVAYRRPHVNTHQ